MLIVYVNNYPWKSNQNYVSTNINILLSIQLITHSYSLQRYHMTIRNDSTKSSGYQVLGPAIDPRALEPTQLILCMNDPAWKLEMVLAPNQPISLRLKTLLLTNHSLQNRPINISLKRGFYCICSFSSALWEGFHCNMQSFPQHLTWGFSARTVSSIIHSNLWEGFHCNMQSFPQSVYITLNQ